MDNLFPTCRSEMNVDYSTAIGGVDAAGVHALVTPPHAPQQQRAVASHQNIREDLRSTFKLWALATKVRSSILILVNKSTQPHLLPGDRYSAEKAYVAFSVKTTAEELILSEVGDGKHVEAQDFGCGAWRDKETATDPQRLIYSNFENDFSDLFLVIFIKGEVQPFVKD